MKQNLRSLQHTRICIIAS